MSIPIGNSFATIVNTKKFDEMSRGGVSVSYGEVFPMAALEMPARRLIGPKNRLNLFSRSLSLRQVSQVLMVKRIILTGLTEKRGARTRFAAFTRGPRSPACIDRLGRGPI